MGALEQADTETSVERERRDQQPAAATGDGGSRPPRKHQRRRRWWAAVAVAVLAVALVLSVTPWPSALLIRSVFEQGAKSTVAEMLPYVPDTPLRQQTDIAYAPDGLLDSYTPADAKGPLPTVVWIHGGAWISGDKRDVAPYLQILAAKGYTTIGLSYPIAPETTYPNAVEDINDALTYIKDHAAELNVDASQIVLAGDSAGAQLASQMATLTVNPDYAQLLGIQPALAKEDLAATILHCGVYDLRAMAELDGLAAWGFKIALWGYTGTKDWSETYAGATMSTIEFASGDLPPTFISGGNADGLTWLQSIPYSNKLKSEGVPVTQLFWAAHHSTDLPHEYQFHLDFPEAQEARDKTFDFLAQHTSP